MNLDDIDEWFTGCPYVKEEKIVLALIACVRAADVYVGGPNAARQEVYADARAALDKL